MTKSPFEADFLDSYLKLGLGSMPKTDIDALVMFLLAVLVPIVVVLGLVLLAVFAARRFARRQRTAVRAA